MDIAGMTIEIWELMVLVSLVLVSSLFVAHYNDSNPIQAQIFSQQINDIGYLSTNRNVSTTLKIDSKTSVINYMNYYSIKVGKDIASKEISKSLVTIKDKNPGIIVIS